MVSEPQLEPNTPGLILELSPSGVSRPVASRARSMTERPPAPRPTCWEKNEYPPKNQGNSLPSAEGDRDAEPSQSRYSTQSTCTQVIHSGLCSKWSLNKHQIQ